MPMPVQYCSGWSIDPLILSPLGEYFLHLLGNVHTAGCWASHTNLPPIQTSAVGGSTINTKFSGQEIQICLSSSKMVWNFQRASDWVLIKIFSMVELLIHSISIEQIGSFRLCSNQNDICTQRKQVEERKLEFFCWQPLKMRSQITCW